MAPTAANKELERQPKVTAVYRTNKSVDSGGSVVAYAGARNVGALKIITDGRTYDEDVGRLCDKCYMYYDDEDDDRMRGRRCQYYDDDGVDNLYGDRYLYCKEDDDDKHGECYPDNDTGDVDFESFHGDSGLECEDQSDSSDSESEACCAFACDYGDLEKTGGSYMVQYEDGSEVTLEEHEWDCGCDLDDN